MRRRIALLLATAMAVVVAIGCSSGGGGGNGGPGTITLANDGGSLLLDSATLGSTGAMVASAVFRKSANPDLGRSQSYGDGHCQGPITGPAVTSTDADAGPSVSFVNGANTVTALKHTNSGIAYSFVSNTALVGGAAPSSWTVSAAGGADIAAGVLATLRVPATTTGVVTPSITAGSAATVTWSAGSGADTILLLLIPSAGSGGIAMTCLPPDTGSFTIPAAVTGSAGNNAKVRFAGVDLDKVTVNGRDMVIEGIRVP